MACVFPSVGLSLIISQGFKAMLGRLSSSLQVGMVQLHVADLEVMHAFYAELVGLEVKTQSATNRVLGYNGRSFLECIAKPDLQPASLGSAGLYHLAICFASQATLATVVQRLLEQRPELWQGSADHLVSEAFYFQDPEGNGVELYWDRPEDTWQWHDGQLQMTSRYIDPIAYIAQHSLTLQEAEQARWMGHVHLRVGNLERAMELYEGVLGLVRMTLMPGALFLSDGAYHHHLGLNTWESQGADRRELSLGLASFELLVAEPDDMQALTKQLQQAAIAFKNIDGSIKVDDPWGNTIYIRCAQDE